MKKKDFLRMFLMVFIAMAGLTACSEDEEWIGRWPPMEWKTDVNMGEGHTVSVPAEGGTFLFSCTNYDGFWLSDIYEDGRYIEPTPPDFEHIAWKWGSVEVKENVLTVVISPNESGIERSIKIDTTAGDIFDHFTFNQAK